MIGTMDKRKPHHDLEKFKNAVANETVVFTRTATRSYQNMSLTLQDVFDTLATLDSGDFYKSMTSRGNSKEWQDVYHKDTEFGEQLYIKFTGKIVKDFKILSFKERN